MQHYSAIYLSFNVLIFLMYAVTFSLTLQPRFGKKGMIFGLFIQGFCWLYVPMYMTVGSIFRSLYPILCLGLPLFVLFRDKWYRIILVFLAVLVSMYVSDLIPTALFFSAEEIVAGLYSNTSYKILIAYGVVLTIQMLLLWILVLFCNRYKNRLAAEEWALYLAFPLSQYLLLFGWLRVCMSEMNLSRTIYVIIAMLVCVGADAGLYLAIRTMAQRSELKAKNEFLSSQLNRQKEHYAAITAQYENIRRMRHDIASHLYTIESLLQAGQDESAASFFADVSAAVHYRSDLGLCENPIVDAYLSSKKQELEAQGYTVQIQVSVPDAMEISNADLVIAFSNLLDNAAEACQNCENRTISLSASMKKGYLSIETQNSFHQDRQKHRRVPELERGIGFHILQDLAHRYEGQFSYRSADGIFTVNLVLKGACAC